MEHFYLKILKNVGNKFIFIILLRQATQKMNVEQILRKESLDQMLHMKRSSEREANSSEDQMMIVGNYLNLPIGASPFFSQQSLNSNECPPITLSIDNPPSLQELSLPQPHNPRKKRSVFHNFQKHLMTTLRSHIKIRRSSHSDHSQSNIASQLWEYFKFSAQISKRFLLCLLLGRSTGWGEGEGSSHEDYGRLVEEFNEYSERELNTAQAYLCREIIRQSKKLIESGAIESRRISQPEEFRDYFERFVGDLESGRVSKRLPKAAKFARNDTNSNNNIQ